MSSQPIRVDLAEDLGVEDVGAGEPRPAQEAETGERASAELHLDHLRRILLGYDDQRLDSLQGWLNDPSFRAEQISEALPRAVRLRPDGDPELGEALAPAIETALVDFVRRDPQAAARLLSPVVGAAIRGALRDAVATPLRVLRLAATLPGLRWLVEAVRTRTSFAAVVDRHTLDYRVEYVLLFHRATGMLLVEVENPRARVSRNELRATVARVRAILGLAEDAEDHPAATTASDLGIVMEQGPRLVAIALVRGNAPDRLQHRLTGVLDAIHLERRLSLKTFAGDPAPFELCRPLLEKLLEAQYDEPHAGTAIWIGAVAVVAAAAAALWYLL